MNHEHLKFVANKPVPVEETRHYEFKEIKGGNPINTIKNTCDEYVVAFLNSGGGRIFWGIRDTDRCVVGVWLDSKARDELRKVVTAKLAQIRPPIVPTAYRVTLHPVYADETFPEPLVDIFIVEIVAPHLEASDDLYATGGGEVFVRTDAGKKKLSIEEIKDEIRRRESARHRVGLEARTPIVATASDAKTRRVFGFLINHEGAILDDPQTFRAVSCRGCLCC